MWTWIETTYAWQPASRLPSLMMWLQNRANRHIDWLDDYSKYVDIRFDSRTGDFLVNHDTNDQHLVWMEK